MGVHIGKFAALAMVGAVSMGCASFSRTDDVAGEREAFAFALPSRIEIVEPFTRIKSLSGGDTPDGIEVLVEAVGALDNPGLVLVGRVRIELFQFVSGSADRKGSRIEQWQVELRTDRQQRTHWNRMTQMYEFRLGANLADIPKSEKYVLLVTYTSPLGSRLSDEIVLMNQAK